MERERNLRTRVLELEKVLNEYVDFCTESNNELGRVVAFRVDSKSGEFEFIGDADDINDLPDGVSENPSSLVLGSFQRKNQLGQILFGYATKKGYGCDEEIAFAAVCRGDIFERPCAGGEKNLGRLHYLV